MFAPSLPDWLGPSGVAVEVELTLSARGSPPQVFDLVVSSGINLFDTADSCK